MGSCMKLLFDENLAARLAHEFADLYRAPRTSWRSASAGQATE